MLSITFMRLWLGLSDLAMDEPRFDVTVYREFAVLYNRNVRLPDESTFLRFRLLLETHKVAGPMLATVNEVLRDKGLILRIGTVMLISAPSSTKNKSDHLDRHVHQTMKGDQWYFGMKVHIGGDAQSCRVHMVKGTAANVNNMTETSGILHAGETNFFGDSGYQGANKRSDAKNGVTWRVAKRPGKRKAPDRSTKSGGLTDETECLKASIRAKVEHPVRVIKRQFAFT